MAYPVPQESDGPCNTDTVCCLRAVNSCFAEGREKTSEEAPVMSSEKS